MRKQDTHEKTVGDDQVSGYGRIGIHSLLRSHDGTSEHLALRCSAAQHTMPDCEATTGVILSYGVGYHPAPQGTGLQHTSGDAANGPCHAQTGGKLQGAHSLPPWLARAVNAHERRVARRSAAAAAPPPAVAALQPRAAPHACVASPRGLAAGLAAPPQPSKQAPQPIVTSSATAAAAALSLSGNAERVASTGTVAGHDAHRSACATADPAAGPGEAAATATGVIRIARTSDPPRRQRTSSPVVTSPRGGEADSAGAREAKRRRVAGSSEVPDAVGPEAPWLGGDEAAEAARGSQGGSQDSATQAGEQERACALGRSGSPGEEEGEGEGQSPLEPSLDWEWVGSEPADEDMVDSGPGQGAAAPGCGQRLHRAASNGSCDGGGVGGSGEGSGEGSGVGPCSVPDGDGGAASRQGGMHGSAPPLQPPPPAVAAGAAAGPPPAAGGPYSFPPLPRAWAQAMGAAAAAAAKRALVPSRLQRRRLGLSDGPAPQQAPTVQPPAMQPPTQPLSAQQLSTQQPSAQQPSTQLLSTQQPSTQQPSAQQGEGEARSPQQPQVPPQQLVQDLLQQEQQADAHAPQPAYEADDSVVDGHTSPSEQAPTQGTDQEAPSSNQVRAPTPGQPHVPDQPPSSLPRSQLLFRRRLAGIVLAGRAPAASPAAGTADAAAAAGAGGTAAAAGAAAGVRQPCTVPGAKRRPAVRPAQQVARRGKGAGQEAAEGPSMRELDLSKAPSYLLPLGREGIRKGVAAVLAALQVGPLGRNGLRAQC